MLAVYDGEVASVRMLLEAGADPEPALEKACEEVETWQEIVLDAAVEGSPAPESHVEALAEAKACLELLENAVKRPRSRPET